MTVMFGTALVAYGAMVHKAEKTYEKSVKESNDAYIATLKARQDAFMDLLNKVVSDK